MIYILIGWSHPLKKAPATKTTLEARQAKFGGKAAEIQ